MQEVPEWKAKLEARRVAKEAADGQAAWRKKKGQVKGCLAAAVLAVLGFGAVASCDPRGSAKAPPAPAPVQLPQVVRPDDQAEARREAIRQAEVERLVRQIEEDIQWLDLAELHEGFQNQLAWEKKWQGKKGRIVGTFVRSAREFGGDPFVMVRSDAGQEVKVLLVGASLPAWAAARQVGERVVLQVEVKGLSPVGNVINLKGLDAMIVPK